MFGFAGDCPGFVSFNEGAALFFSTRIAYNSWDFVPNCTCFSAKAEAIVSCRNTAECTFLEEKVDISSFKDFAVSAACSGVAAAPLFSHIQLDHEEQR